MQCDCRAVRSGLSRRVERINKLTGALVKRFENIIALAPVRTLSCLLLFVAVCFLTTCLSSVLSSVAVHLSTCLSIVCRLSIVYLISISVYRLSSICLSIVHLSLSSIYLYRPSISIYPSDVNMQIEQDDYLATAHAALQVKVETAALVRPPPARSLSCHRHAISLIIH